MWQLPSSNRTGTTTEGDAVEGTDEGVQDGGDREAGRLLRVIDDAHQERQSVIVCAFTSLPTVAVSVDSGGSVYQMDFKLVHHLFGLRFDSLGISASSGGF